MIQKKSRYGDEQYAHKEMVEWLHSTPEIIFFQEPTNAMQKCLGNDQLEKFENEIILKTSGFKCPPSNNVLAQFLAEMENRVEGWVKNIFARYELLAHKFNPDMFGQVFLEGIAGLEQILSKAICVAIVAGSNILLNSFNISVGMVRGMEERGRCLKDDEWKSILGNPLQHLEDSLQSQGETGDVHRALREIEDNLSKEINRQLQLNFSPSLLADLIVGVIIATAGAAAIIGTGGLGAPVAAPVVAGLLLIIRQLLQGMNLEAFRGKTPEEMARMLPDYEQLVQATQIALEKNTDVQTEYAALGGTA